MIAPLRFFQLLTRNKSPIEIQRRVALVRRELSELSQNIDYLCNTKFRDSFIQPDNNKNKIISPRPLQVLQALADGSCPTLGAVAEKLDISIDTANHHIATAKKNLGATSTYNAIAIAIDWRLVQLD